MIEATSKVYIEAFEAITEHEIRADLSGETPTLARVRANLAPYFSK